MQRYKQTVPLWILAMAFSYTSFAVEPAYKGHLGNPEEPALRPYKWFIRGLASLTYQTSTAFKKGNEDFPIIGSAYTFRGLRKGIIEFERSIWRGMCGANNRTVSYKDTGKANAIIEEDLLLRNAADALTAAYAWGVLTSSAQLRPQIIPMSKEAVHVNGTAVQLAGATFFTQKVLDRSTPVPQWDEKKQHPSSLSKRKEAQQRYIGGRAKENNLLASGKGNFLKLAK